MTHGRDPKHTDSEVVMFERARARLLVVDDEAATRVTLEAGLRRQGYEVATAANGEEALGWLMQREFELVLINPTLPGMSGIALAGYTHCCQPATQVLFLNDKRDTRGRTGGDVLDRVADALVAPIESEAGRIAAWPAGSSPGRRA